MIRTFSLLPSYPCGYLATYLDVNPFLVSEVNKYELGSPAFLESTLTSRQWGALSGGFSTLSCLSYSSLGKFYNSLLFQDVGQEKLKTLYPKTPHSLQAWVHTCEVDSNPSLGRSLF